MLTVAAALPLFLALSARAAPPDDAGPLARSFWGRVRKAQGDLKSVRARCQFQTILSSIALNRVDEGTVCWLRKPDGSILQRWDLEGPGPDETVTKTTYLVTDTEIVTLTDGQVSERGPLWCRDILNVPALGGPVLSIPRDAYSKEPDLQLEADEEEFSDREKPAKKPGDPASPAGDFEDAGSPALPPIPPEERTLAVTFSPRRGPWKDLLASVCVELDPACRLVRQNRFLETGNNQYIVSFSRFEINPELEEGLFALPASAPPDPDRR